MAKRQRLSRFPQPRRAAKMDLPSANMSLDPTCYPLSSFLHHATTYSILPLLLVRGTSVDGCSQSCSAELIAPPASGRKRGPRMRCASV
ncbi:hypothetical protein BD779DRAFT_1589170 [Infundibulicybe gibba]|nr:hypothetical protein BD779DRAFT_1589170 [Infundibulicybe gibba]